MAKADELPPSACGARLRLNLLGSPILQALQDAGIVGNHGGVGIAISAIVFRNKTLRGPTVSRPGYFVGEDDTTGRMHLYALGSEMPKVVAVWELDTGELSGTQGALVASSGVLEGALVGLEGGRKPAVFVYKTPMEANGATPSEPGKLLVGVETASGPLVLESASTLFGAPSPDVYGAQLVYASHSRQVLLIGNRLPGGPGPIEAWRLDLEQGTWTGPTRLALPQRRTGLSPTYDPLTDRVLIFGGRLSIGGDTAEVLSIDPKTLFVHRFATVPPDASLGLPRSRSGIFLDPVERALYVYGGRRIEDIVADKDVWKLDLATRRWTREVETSFVDSPEPVIQPLIYHNRRTGTTYVGDLLDRSTADGIALWALDEDGYWHASEAFRRPGSETWPLQGDYSPGSAPTHVWPTPDTIDWPGQLLLARLQSASTRLGLSVISQSGEVLVQSDAVASSDQEAAFICPVGQRCYLQVTPLPLGGGNQWERYTLDVLPAELVLTHQQPLVPGSLRDLVLKDDVVYAASMAGLQALQADSTLTPLSSIGGGQVASMTALTICARYLCASRMGNRGLTVIDIADPTLIRVAGSTKTVGAAWDIAASGTTAFVAQGGHGVGLYDISDASAPVLIDQLSTQGRVITVAVADGVVAAGLNSGQVQLWDVSGSPVSVGLVQAKGKISRARFVAGQLWLLGGGGSWVEIYDVRDPTTPMKLGEITTDASKLFNGDWFGNHMFTFQGHLIDVYEVRALP